MAFSRLIERMRAAGAGTSGEHAIEVMGREYFDSTRTSPTDLRLQLQAFAACGDDAVRDDVRRHMSHMWQVASERTGLDPVAVKTFLAFGMLLNTAAALDVDSLTDGWAEGIRTRIEPGLFSGINEHNNVPRHRNQR